MKEGCFYGHPASLVWKKDWDGRDPLKIDSKELDDLQQPAAGFFPQGELANSPTWPVIIPAGAFPEGMVGQTLIGEMNQKNLVRVLDDEVEGVFQTALVPVFNGSPLENGGNRIAFGNDGAIYVGKTALSWAGGKGITKIKWNGKPFASLDKVNAVKGGFALHFSEPIDPSTLRRILVTSYTYKYHAEYGSPKVDEQEIDIKGTQLSTDGLTLVLDLGGLKEGYLHHINMEGLRTKAGKELLGANAWYHVIKAPK